MRVCAVNMFQIFADVFLHFIIAYILKNTLHAEYIFGPAHSFFELVGTRSFHSLCGRVVFTHLLTSPNEFRIRQLLDKYIIIIS